MPAKVLFARFPFGNSETPDIADWLVTTVLKAKSDPRISEVLHVRIDDTPITLSRNWVMKYAEMFGVNLVCMVDSDMKPDLYLGGQGVQPFWDSSLDFMLAHEGPCVVGAPYCGRPPNENTMVCLWRKAQSDHPNVDLRLALYEREEAAVRGGIEEVGALPTGLILIDVRALKAISPPYFDYEYEDPPFNTRKATTEDIYFTRNLSLAGVPQYVNWDAWAGHFKTKCVGKPTLLTRDMVAEGFRDAVRRDWNSRERLIDIRQAPDLASNGQAVKPCPYEEVAG